MIVYALRNDKDEYVSMSGDKTKDWLKASKFAESELEKRLKFIDDEFQPVCFEVKEIQK